MNRRPVFDSTTDVVDVDVVAEHCRGVHIVLLDRRAGESDEGRIRQRVAQVLGETVGDLAGLLDPRLEPVLAAVRFVGDHHHVPSVGKLRVGLALLRCELLDGGEHHPARCAREGVLQILAAIRLNRRLADQVAAHREGAEELVVQVVPVGDDNDGRIFHCRFAHQLPGIESHQQALARPLRVPDNPNLAVAPGTAGVYRAGHGPLYGVELVVARDDLGNPAGRVAEDRDCPSSNDLEQPR